MPDRYLREALLRSDRWNSLTADAQNLYVRLLMIVDDFGCYDGREQVIAQQAYYLGRDEPLPLGALHECGLIVRYLNANKPFIAMMRWGETLRGRRRWPAPPINNDLPEIKYRGKYGTTLNFRNPVGTDAVSILVDVRGRPVTPQPPEWRRTTTDWLPISDPLQPLPTGPDSHSAQSLPAVTTVPEPMPAAPARKDSARSVVSSQGSRVIEQESAVVVPMVTSPSAQSLQATPPTPPPPNGEIKLNSAGEWLGLSEAQRLRWQGMFAELAIPDEVERAGQWLLVNVEERAIYERQEDGMRAFLIRWLLKAERMRAEAAARTQPARAGTDSQGKR